MNTCTNFSISPDSRKSRRASLARVGYLERKQTGSIVRG